MKHLRFTLVAICLLLGGLAWWRVSASAARPDLGKTRETAIATLGALSQRVECTGSVTANMDVEIKCKVSGEIIGLPFDVSDGVKKGDLLLEIDPVDQLRNLQQAEASLDSSKARFAQAEANLRAAEKELTASSARAQASVLSAKATSADAAAKYARDEALLEKKHISVEEAETSRTTMLERQASLGSARADLAAVEAQRAQLDATRQDIKMAEVQIVSDTAALELARQRLTETKVVSPIDGVVSTRDVQVGQIISSGVNNVSGGTTVVTVSDLSRLFVLASVDESDIGNVAIGQEVRLSVDAYPKRSFRGVVQRIASAGTNTANVVSFEVKIEVTSEDLYVLKPAMTANVEVITAKAEGVVTIPIRALSRKGTKEFVSRLSDYGSGPQEFIPVKTGVSDGVLIEVKSGLREGDEIVLVRDGDASEWRKEEGGRRGPPSPFGTPRKKS